MTNLEKYVVTKYNKTSGFSTGNAALVNVSSRCTQALSQNKSPFQVLSVSSYHQNMIFNKYCILTAKNLINPFWPLSVCSGLIV